MFGKKSKPMPAISTASLPDIVFMLLFFFMVTTVLRETDQLVEVHVPQASQLQKLEDKSLVSYIYIGAPKEKTKFGSEPRIQVNDVFILPRDIPRFVAEERAKLPTQSQRDKITMSLKVDKTAKMGIVNDVKMQLREADARKVNYASVASGAVEE